MTQNCGLRVQVLALTILQARDGRKSPMTQIANTYFTAVRVFFPFARTLANPRLKLL